MKIINTSQAMPKPGRYVLAWMEGAKIPMRAMWAAQHTLPLGDDADPEWGEYSEEKDEYFCPAGWYEMNQHEEQHWGVDGNVVAWCELPRLDAGAAPAAVAPEHPPMPETWAVVASIEGQDVVCISSSALSGKGELTESEEQAVIGMAQHLLAFVGYGLPPCDFDPDDEPAPAPALEAPAPVTLMTEDQASRWAWDQIREEVGTKGWTAGDSSNFFGFFLHGWNYRGQYELQRPAAMARAALAAAPQAPVVRAALSEGVILAVDKWFSQNTGLGGCSDKDAAELAAIFAAAPQAPAAPSIAVVTDEQIDAILDSPGGLGMVIADKRERMRMFARRVLDLAAPAAPAVDTERAAYIEFLTGKFPRSYGKEEAGRWWDQGHVSALAWQAARTATAAPAAPVVDDEGCLSDELRDLITGMTVSVDVSTGEHDAGNRLFGEVTEVMEYDQGSDKHRVVLLVQSPEPNFKVAPAAPAVDAALNALIADVRALPTLRASEIDGEESDGTPKHWRNRPFVSLRKLEALLRDRVTTSSDTALLNFIAAEYLELRSFGMPTGQGDADVGWRVIQHHMGEPTERVVSEVYKDDPRSAIRAAIARLERDPYCTGALHEEDAEAAAQAAAKGEHDE